MSFQLTHNAYGKSAVRLTKVVRKGDTHHLMELDVAIQLTGDFAASYLAGDNTAIIATDSMKNTVYVLAKENDFDSCDDFAVLLARHFVKTYPQVDSATIDIQQSAWQRILSNGKPHDHSFISGGSELRTSHVHLARSAAKALVTGGLTNLLVLKTTDSLFKDFVNDRYRTLKDADDRIFATSVTATWDYTAETRDFNEAHDTIRDAMLQVFAQHRSLAVQQTMYEMGRAALSACGDILNVNLRLPNKHRIPVNLEPFGLKNNNEIFVWTDEPYGDILATVERD